MPRIHFASINPLGLDHYESCIKKRTYFVYVFIGDHQKYIDLPEV